MKVISQFLTSLLVLPATTLLNARDLKQDSAIYSGVEWLDNWGEVVNAHGANIKEKNQYYFFSERHSDISIGFYGLTRPNGGYAQVTIENSKGIKVLSSSVDMYCKYPVATLNFLSPVLQKGNYSMTVTVMSERSNWSDKKENNDGSTGNFVSIDKNLIS